MSTEILAARDLTAFKGVDIIVNKNGCTFVPVIIRNVTDKGEDWATYDFETQRGRKFVSACVSKKYHIDEVCNVLFEEGVWTARIWTFASNDEAKALLKNTIRKRIAEEISLLSEALSFVID